KLLEDLKELAEYKESLDNSSKEIATSSSNQEKEESPQDSDIHKLIREECCVELLCMHDNVDDLIESALNSKLLSINSQRLEKENQKVKNVVEQQAERRNLAPILSSKEPEYSTSMGYENPNTTPETESDEIIKSGVEELVPILKSDNYLSDNFSPEFETFCDYTEETRSGNTTTHADDSLPEYDPFCFEIEPDQERLINVLKSNIPDDSSSDPLLEEADLFFASDNSIPPGIENVADDSEGGIRFLEALLIDDSIPFPNNESSESDFDNPSFPRPPPEPPDAEYDFELDAGDEISVVMNVSDELECIDEFDYDNYHSFIYLICSKMFLSFLSAESEDTIFDPSIFV
nr:hypothetical protein [Tanacetum cinerariifolium]